MLRRLPATLTGEDTDAAVAVLRDYSQGDRPAPAYTGRWFDDWDSPGTPAADQHRFTADDFVAVTHLSVAVPPRAAVRLPHEEQHQASDLIKQVPTDLHLADMTISEITPDWPAWRLWTLLRSGRDGLGPTTTSKLLARKRPRLLPVQDSHTQLVTGLTTDVLRPMCHALQRDGKALHRRLEALHGEARQPSGSHTPAHSRRAAVDEPPLGSSELAGRRSVSPA